MRVTIKKKTRSIEAKSAKETKKFAIFNVILIIMLKVAFLSCQDFKLFSLKKNAV